MKILLAVDGSPFTKKMLAYLAAHEELVAAGRHDYTALTVQPALPPRARAVLSKEMVDEYYAEEFAKGVDAQQIMSLLKQVPTRITSTPEVLRAMSEVSNEDIARLVGAPYMVYVEGESDERILRGWAEQCGALAVMGKLHHLRGCEPSVEVLRERVAAAMTADEIHEDVHQFFATLVAMVGQTKS